MTTFEITIIVLLAVVVLLLGFIAFCVWNHYRDVEYSNFMLRKKLDNIDTNTATSVSVAQDISRQLNNIEDNNDQDFKKLTDIVDKMHRNLCVEIADKMVDRVYKQPTSVNGTPCYAPDGICTNPCRDCINCPKRSDGGTWTTNIIKEE